MSGGLTTASSTESIASAILASTTCADSAAAADHRQDYGEVLIKWGAARTPRDTEVATNAE